MPIARQSSKGDLSARSHEEEIRSSRQGTARSRTDALKWSRSDAAIGGKLDAMKKQVYLLFDAPRSSVAATVMCYFILACIIVSALAIHLESIPALEQYPLFWAGLEVLFVIIFSAEYLLRYWASPLTSKEFFWDNYNLIDFIAIMPFYIVVAVEGIMSLTGYELELNLAMIRVLRLFRIFKVAKYSHSTQLMLKSLQRAVGELMFLVGFMFCALVLFGTLMYAVEQGEYDEALDCHVRPGESTCSPFESIPGTFYWGITTMTTVGYGDILPVTRAGTVVACMTMFMGILVIALPVTMISNAFMDAHDDVSTEVKRTHILDTYHELTEEEQGLVNESEKLRSLLARVQNGLGDIHVKGAELLIADGHKTTPEAALSHWDDRIGLAAEVVKKGLINLKAFAVILRPHHVC